MVLIEEYLSRHATPKYAQAKLQEIYDAIADLPKFPQAGKVVSMLFMPYIRQSKAGKYKILYQYIEGYEIKILRIVHASQNTDFDNLVFEPESEYNKG